MAKRPNIIILNPDEMRWDSMGHTGNPAACTPSLDLFQREEAVSFSNAYCQNPVCVPSRCSFLTGLYPHTRGHRTMNYLLHEDETSLFRELKEAGYYVWMNSRNDLIAGQISGLEQLHADEVYYYNKEEPVSRISPEAFRQMMAGRKKADGPEFPYSHYNGVTTREMGSDMDDTRAACHRISHPVEPEKPLCLFLGWTNPHTPYMTLEKYRSRIDKSRLEPRVRYEETSGKSRIIERLNELCGMESFGEERWTELRATYLAQCSMVDDMFKMVCDALREAGEYDNSAIFFLSDHGDFTGDYGLPEKAQNTFEHCLTRVPLLIKPPRGEALDPGICTSLTELVDFYATALDYAGVPATHTCYGKSLRSLIGNRDQPHRRFVFCEGGRNPGEIHCDEYHAAGPKGTPKTNVYWPRQSAQTEDDAHAKGTMVFDGRFKYVHRTFGSSEFYDLDTDPKEKKNMIGQVPEETLAVYRLAMLDWYQKTCDEVPYAADSRFTEERVWSACRRFCPEGGEERVREAIRNGLDIQKAVGFCMKLAEEPTKQG